MSIILAEITNTARSIWPRMHGQLLPFSPISYFKYGEGGWASPGPTRRTPDPTLTDLDAVVDLSRPLIDKRYPADSLFVYQKNFILADFVYLAPGTLRCRCYLDFGEANDDGFGNPPEFWEIGLFDAANRMVAYGTVPLQLKNGNNLENFVEIVYGT